MIPQELNHGVCQNRRLSVRTVFAPLGTEAAGSAGAEGLPEVQELPLEYTPDAPAQSRPLPQRSGAGPQGRLAANKSVRSHLTIPASWAGTVPAQATPALTRKARCTALQRNYNQPQGQRAY